MNWWQPDLTIGYLYNLLPGLDVLGLAKNRSPTILPP
jgi:hypothetical protein